MLAKEYKRMKTLADKISKDPAGTTVEEAAEYLSLLEMTNADVILKACQDVLRKNAAEKKKEFTTAYGKVTVSEPYVLAVNEQQLMEEAPALYQSIWEKKAAKIKIAVGDLDKDDQVKYTHFIKSTAKVRVDLA